MFANFFHSFMTKRRVKIAAIYISLIVTLFFYCVYRLSYAGYDYKLTLEDNNHRIYSMHADNNNYCCTVLIQVDGPED